MKILADNNFPNYKWREIGVNLDIKYNQLRDIKSENSECYDRLCECIAVWLKTGRATYNKLIDAVKGTGEPAVAGAIKKHLSRKFCAT